MLFRCDAGHGLEPVGVMGGALFQRPLLHGLGDGVGHVQRKVGALVDAALPGGVHVLGKPLLHGVRIEYVAAE